MSDWQPIETAPRDGTWVLICGGTLQHDEGQGDVCPPMVVARSYEDPIAPWQQVEWEFAQFDGGLPICIENPTKWMPLPDPRGDADPKTGGRR